MRNQKEEVLPTHLINLSGGADSTYCVIDYLKKNDPKTLVIHHTILNYGENRWREELKSVQSTLEWAKANGYEGFTYIETMYKQPAHMNAIFDIVLFDGYIASSILKTYPSIHTIIQCSHGEESEGARLRDSIANQVRELVGMRKINVSHPIRNMKKVEVINGIPEELRGSVWCCRNPEKPFVPCRKCHACLDVIKANLARS